MSTFKGNDPIILQPNDANIAYTFHLDTCTSSTANDGKLAYGTTISGVTATATNSSGDTDTELIASTSLSTPDIILTLSYPTTNGIDRYKITFVLDISDGSTKELDFPIVYAKDI